VTAKLYTLTQIAELCDRDRSVIHRRIEEMGITPAFVAGSTRLYTHRDTQRIIKNQPAKETSS
jgi:hypothetical protein